MELNENMYVRDTRNGTIYKISEFLLDFRPQKETYDFEKASYDIIDLIEVGDYVNGSKVSIIESKFIYWETGNSIHKKYIESIVTKEQFESISYKVD